MLKVVKGSVSSLFNKLGATGSQKISDLNAEDDWEIVSNVQDVYIGGILTLLRKSGNKMTVEEGLQFSGLKMKLPNEILRQYSVFLKSKNLELITSASQILPFFEQYA